MFYRLCFGNMFQKVGPRLRPDHTLKDWVVGGSVLATIFGKGPERGGRKWVSAPRPSLPSLPFACSGAGRPGPKGVVQSPTLSFTPPFVRRPTPSPTLA